MCDDVDNCFSHSHAHHYHSHSPLHRYLTTLEQAFDLASSGKIPDVGKVLTFKFGNAEKRKHFVDKDGWVLVISDNQDGDGNLSDTADILNGGNTIISKEAAAQIPDVGRIQLGSANRTSMRLESSNANIINRFKNYTCLSYEKAHYSEWDDFSQIQNARTDIGASNSQFANSPLSEQIYVTGLSPTTSNILWQPESNITGVRNGRYNARLWVRYQASIPF